MTFLAQSRGIQDIEDASLSDLLLTLDYLPIGHLFALDLFDHLTADLFAQFFAPADDLPVPLFFGHDFGLGLCARIRQ